MVQDVVNFRFACYGYFAIVYSLLIAAISSIVQSQLTQRDTVFVIVAVASPATVYLWFLTAIHLIRPKSMPLSLSRMNKIEKFLVSILSVCLFFFWLAMLPAVFLPSSLITFSQPACNKQYELYNVMEPIRAVLSPVMTWNIALLVVSRGKADGQILEIGKYFHCAFSNSVMLITIKTIVMYSYCGNTPTSLYF